ncbi:class I SAM-dependent methyltransferase [Aliiruegeria sabulilitoris]|uniref:class I SAM-dependent methyltransferase n=1 Tax=Aliiruegeria sabulilitoris TaxID=1510458 RepID=UPI00082AF4B6|nr:class I SAM-dependent methyltransferase [Aliiruegeria sabulilitoris]NDR59190.1 class I SAM-dependent methyltransferase [Pseudoruegeria sp. M32A2M]
MLHENQSLEQIAQRLQALREEMHAQCQLIAQELDKADQMNRQAIFAAQNRITQQIHLLRQLIPQFDAAYHAAGETLEIAGGARQIRPPDWLAFSAHVGLMRNWANGWSAVQARISEQCPPRRRSLEYQTEKASPVHAAALDAADRTVAQLLRALAPNAPSAATARTGYGTQTGLTHSEFMALALACWRVLKAQGRHDLTRFLDVGCGVGLQVLSALQFFDEAFGLERDPDYAQAARDLFGGAGAAKAGVLEGEARNFASYDRFDAIQICLPLKPLQELKELEEYVITSARPETLLIVGHGGFAPRAEALGCARIATRLYLTGTTPRKAASLRRKAELIGTNVTPESAPLRSVWEPILQASRRRGY